MTKKPTIPIGTDVAVTMDDGTQFLTKTLSKPWMASGTAIIKVDGITGGYDLERVKPIAR